MSPLNGHRLAHSVMRDAEFKDFQDFCRRSLGNVSSGFARPYGSTRKEEKLDEDEGQKQMTKMKMKMKMELTLMITMTMTMTVKVKVKMTGR